MDAANPYQKPEDPRGRGFRDRVPVEFVRSLIEQHVGRLNDETIALADAHRRVLAKPVIAESPVPHFARAAMDGYALIASETKDAAENSPAKFTVTGRSRPGSGYAARVYAGQAVAIATGAPMPAGADAVVPVEFTEIAGAALKVRAAVTTGRNVGMIGEDVEPGDALLAPGRCLRPQDLGILSALGFTKVPVFRQPRVAVIITGDELLPAGSPPNESAIPDMNSPMLAALIRRDGGIPVIFGPLSDDFVRLKTRFAEITEDPAIDAVLLSGGSSTGPEDHTPALIRAFGLLMAHGVALKPAGPTGFGLVRSGKPVVLLPGNPVSCLCAYDFFGGVIVRKLGGRSEAMPYPIVRRRLAGTIWSSVGRVDYVRVRSSDLDEVAPIATSGASKLSTTIAACGFVIVPAETENIAEGSMVEVLLYDIA